MVTTSGRISNETIERDVMDKLRFAGLDTGRIEITVDSGHVMLLGGVRSWSESGRAADIAWSTPGVCVVLNDLHPLR